MVRACGGAFRPGNSERSKGSVPSCRPCGGTAVQGPASTAGKRPDFVIARPSGRGNPFSCRRYGGVIARGNDRDGGCGRTEYGRTGYGRTGNADCHASDIGHWLAMTRMGGGCLGRALNERRYGQGTAGRRRSGKRRGAHCAPLRAGDGGPASEREAVWRTLCAATGGRRRADYRPYIP